MTHPTATTHLDHSSHSWIVCPPALLTASHHLQPSLRTISRRFQPTSISLRPEPNFSKSPATNASSLFCSRTRGHSSCSNSANTGLVKERQLEKLCIMSPPIDPNHQLDDRNKKVETDVGRGLSRDGDVDMNPVAAAASTVSSSTDPISTIPQPTTAVQAVHGSTSLTASPPAPTPNQDADHAMQESKESDSRPSTVFSRSLSSPIQARSTSLPSAETKRSLFGAVEPFSFFSSPFTLPYLFSTLPS